MTDLTRLFELKLKGYCCSQILMKMGMEDAGYDDDPDLIQAVRGLCHGIHTEMICGLLTSAACLLSLLEPQNSKSLITELTEWFEAEFGEGNGGITCRDIIAGDPINRTTKCPNILAAMYDQIIELLEVNGSQWGTTKN